MSYSSQLQQQHGKPDYGMHFQPIGLPLPENVHSKVPRIYAPSPEEQEIVKNAVAPQPKVSPSHSKTSTKGRAPPPPPAYSPPSYKKGGGASPVDLQMHKSRTLTSNKSNKNQSSTKSNSNIVGGGVTKSHSFRSIESSTENIEYPSLPIQAPYNDIILKKNKSLSSVLDSEDAKNSSRMKFHSSIQNWSHANEGLKRSISSLTTPLTIDNLVVPNSHSNESLKTITSLLEEPDILVQTRVGERNQDGKKPKSNPPTQNMEEKSLAATSAHPVNSFYDVIFTKEFGQLPEKPDFSKLIRNPLDFVQQDSSLDIVQDSSIDSFHEVGGTDRSLTEACVVSDSNTYHYKDDVQKDVNNKVIEDNDNNLSEEINDINEELCLARVPSSFEDKDFNSDKSDTSQEDEKLSLDAHEQEIDTNQEEMGGVVAGQLDVNQTEEISAVAAQPIMDEGMQHTPPVKAEFTTPTPPDSLTIQQQQQYGVEDNCPSVVTYGALIPPPPLDEVHNSTIHQKQEKSDAVKKQTSFTERDDNTHTIHAKHFNKQNNEPQNIAEIKEQDFLKDNEEKILLNINNTKEEGDEEILEVENVEENSRECLNSGEITGTTLIEHTPVIGATPSHASGLEHLKDQTQQQHQHSSQQQKHESEKTPITMDKLAQKSNHETKILNEDFKHVDENICSEANAKDVVEALATIVDKIDVSTVHDNRAKVLNGDVIENTKISHEFESGSADIIALKEEVKTERVNENFSPIDESGKDDAKVKVENEINNPIIEDKHEAATTPNHDYKTENVSSKPAVGVKPVPAPRHFFLKPLNDEPAPNSELENIFARRSRSIRNLREVKDLDNNDVKADSNFYRSKSARNLGDIHRPATVGPDPLGGEPAAANINLTDQLLNVKERAKSFTNNITPQPFRPKPTNIPPKPKLPVKPVPAPRTFRSVSSANLGPTIRRPNLEVKPGSKSASNILTNTSRISLDNQNNQNEPLSTEIEKLDNSLQSPDILSDIQVKKIRQNFLSGDQTKPTTNDNIPTQQSNDNNISNRVLKSTDNNTSPATEIRTSPVAADKPSLPEKPTRRIRELSMERQLTINEAEDNLVNKANNNEENEEENENINAENSGAATNGKKKKNVMSIVSRINAMAL